MQTQTVIIGGGPAGMLLSVLLCKIGVDNVVLERKNKEYVTSRIRAGIIEETSVETLMFAGVGDGLQTSGFTHTGCEITSENQHFRVDFDVLAKASVRVYGQTEITKDLYRTHQALNGKIYENVRNVQLEELNSDKSRVRFEVDGQEQTINCQYIVGCDGFHGVSRPSIPNSVRTEYEKSYPFGWLGVLSKTPPVAEELVYAQSKRGFALASMRNQNLSRYYIQVSSEETVEQWSDDQFWTELKKRLPEQVAKNLITGPSIEKSIAPLRSFVCEPMQWGNLFLCGDAAHIVPPTGAKGLNLAISDVRYLYDALALDFLHGDKSGLEAYSQKALARVWQAVRFSWSMTKLLHEFPETSAFDHKIQQAEIDLLANSRSAQETMARSYVGTPL